MQPKFTDRAISYLKAIVADNSSESITLSRDDSPVLRPFAEGLCISYVVDDGGEYQYVQHRHLDQDGITEDELHQVGLRNLIDILSQRNLQVQPYQNIYAVLAGGDFEASAILLDQFWDTHFREFISSEFSIAVPARDVLAFCDSTSKQGRNELQDLIDRIFPNGDHLISDKIYDRHQNAWQIH